MNIKYLSALLSASALFAACDNDENMGADIMPSTDRPNIVVTDTINIKAFTVQEDSVYSSNQTQMLVGCFNDPVFGKTDAAFCAKFSNTSYGKFPNDAICDSVVLTMGLDSTAVHFYGDVKAKSSISIYPLTKELYADSSYYSNYNYKAIIADEAIATAEFIPDTVTRKISVNLPVDFGIKVMKCTQDTTFDANFYGLCFQQGTDCSIITKTTIYNSNIQYNVYYHCEGDTASTAVTFTIANSNARVSFFTHDYSGTNIPSDSESDTLLYLQSMGGTRIMLDMSDVQKLNIYDNSEPRKYFSLMGAQLIMPVDSNLTDYINYTPIKEINCIGIEKAETKKRQNLYEFIAYDSYGNASVYPISFDKSRMCYSVNLTARVNDYLKTYKANSEPSYDICLCPYSGTSDFSRTVINAPSKKSAPMKLVVQYTVFEK